MTQVRINYHMKRENEATEASITLPMEDSVAEMLLDTQNDCFLLIPGGPLSVILRELAQLQGYTYAEFQCAHQAEG